MKRVLIVDDASFMRMSIKNMLANYDFEIVGEAENGVMAIEKYKELQPDIVTMDITMPEMDGLEALREIKKILVYLYFIFNFLVNLGTFKSHFKGGNWKQSAFFI